MCHRTVIALMLALPLFPTLACSDQEGNSNDHLTLEIRSDLQVPTELDTLRIDLHGRHEQSFPFELAPTAGEGKQSLPVRFALLPGDHREESFEVEIVGACAGQERVRQAARLTLKPVEDRTVAMVLARDCVGNSFCDGDTTCTPGSVCVPRTNLAALAALPATTGE